MRFGISATSWIFPKNLRTRLRPVNVSAIVLSRFDRVPALPATVSPGHATRLFGERPGAAVIGEHSQIELRRNKSPNCFGLSDSGCRQHDLPDNPNAGSPEGSAPRNCRLIAHNYLSSTLAPAFSRVAL